MSEAEHIFLTRTLADFVSRLTEEYKCEFRYLDLVDASSGNVWATADEEVIVYWHYPKDTEKTRMPAVLPTLPAPIPRPLTPRNPMYP